MVHINIHIKDINITFVGITTKHIWEGKVGRYIYIKSFHLHTDIYSYINVYRVGDRLCSAGYPLQKKFITGNKKGTMSCALFTKHITLCRE